MSEASIRNRIRSAPVIGPALVRTRSWVRRAGFRNSGTYWERRYASGGFSGAGSVGQLAAYKAAFLNDLVRDNDVETVIEWGCGDGRQLELAHYRRYIGLDVSVTAIKMCAERFAGDQTKSFFAYVPDAFADRAQLFRAELAISLDVIYHLVEDDVYHRYMEALFGSATELVVIYSNDQDERQSPHVRGRRFTEWVKMNAVAWDLVKHEPNPNPYDARTGQGSWADFFVYERAEPE